MPVQKVNPAGAIISLVMLAFGAWYFYGGGVEQHAATEMQRIEQQVAADAVRQYDIAKRQGTLMDICVQAGLVSAAYLQAKDEEQYRNWKAIENSDCARAGVPNH